MKEVYLKEPPIIYGYMIYECEKCGERFRMDLECGVEDHGDHGIPHQPCPFVIRHDKCGGFAHDCSGVIPYSIGQFRAKPGTWYFAYDDSGEKHACGKSSIYGYKAEEGE